MKDPVDSMKEEMLKKGMVNTATISEEEYDNSELLKKIDNIKRNISPKVLEKFQYDAEKNLENRAEYLVKKGYNEPFVQIALEIGKLVEEKNKSYGNAFAESEKILQILYPNGVKPDQYTDFLGMVRVIDKLFRIATDKDALGESPWKDITGYGLLGIRNDNKRREGE